MPSIPAVVSSEPAPYVGSSDDSAAFTWTPPGLGFLDGDNPLSVWPYMDPAVVSCQSASSSWASATCRVFGLWLLCFVGRQGRPARLRSLGFSGGVIFFSYRQGRAYNHPSPAVHVQGPVLAFPLDVPLKRLPRAPIVGIR